jgi:chemotaxis protein MotB
MLVMAASLVAGCGVSKAKYMDVTKSRDELQAQNQQLQSSLDQANKDKAQLESDKAAMDSQVKQLQAQTEAAQKQTEETKGTYEQMIQHLQGEVSSGEVEIKQLKDVITVNLAQDILFKSGSAELDQQGHDILMKVVDDLKSSPFKIAVSGHTDDQKISKVLARKYPSNWELGAARAAVIVRLFEDSGIAKDRLAAVSYADSRPREANDTPAGREKNRRIEIRLIPPQNEPSAGS